MPGVLFAKHSPGVEGTAALFLRNFNCRSYSCAGITRDQREHVRVARTFVMSHPKRRFDFVYKNDDNPTTVNSPRASAGFRVTNVRDGRTRVEWPNP